MLCSCHRLQLLMVRYLIMRGLVANVDATCMLTLANSDVGMLRELPFGMNSLCDTQVVSLNSNHIPPVQATLQTDVPSKTSGLMGSVIPTY